MAGKGRKPGFRMSDAHRVKIQNSNVLNALVEHVEGIREMSSTQVTAGIALMRKVLPDLSNVTVEGAGESGEHIVRHEADEAFARVVQALEQARPDAAGDSGGTE